MGSFFTNSPYPTGPGLGVQRDVELWKAAVLFGRLISGNGGFTLPISVAGGFTGKGAPNGKVTKITAAVAGTAVLPANPARRSVTLRCDPSSAEGIAFDFTSPAGANSFPLNAGDSISVDVTAAIYFYGAAGTGVIFCAESYD